MFDFMNNYFLHIFLGEGESLGGGCQLVLQGSSTKRRSGAFGSLVCSIPMFSAVLPFWHLERCLCYK